MFEAVVMSLGGLISVDSWFLNTGPFIPLPAEEAVSALHSGIGCVNGPVLSE